MIPLARGAAAQATCCPPPADEEADHEGRSARSGTGRSRSSLTQPSGDGIPVRYPRGGIFRVLRPLTSGGKKRGLWGGAPTPPPPPKPPPPSPFPRRRR